MRFSLTDSLSLAGSGHNEDRLGQHGAAAWIIDGATDLAEARLLPGESDAAWFAQALNARFARLASEAGGASTPLDAMLARLTQEMRAGVIAAAVRPIAARHEQPSAAGIFARLRDGDIEALSLGDCTLLALDGEGAPLDLFRQHGRREADEEARAAAADAVRAREATRPDQAAAGGIAAIRAGLMPLLRASRARMNIPGGYGIFSIDEPQPGQALIARRRVAPGDRFLLATDGFLRLVDVYGAYSLAAFGTAIMERGLIALAAELRAIEADDAAGNRFPRAKTRDDATAMILHVVA